ncbi:MAG: acetyltransferase [Zetaproteobacteria bacterium]|nr:acetyltransferase [Zetaproteobacteria bacterium]
MTHYDIFNGDADGICALIQLRLAHPVRDEILITGTKRDIQLVQQVKAKHGDHLTILDISMAKNHDPLVSAIALGATIDYFDHHDAGNIPTSPQLNAHIDTAAETCTSLIVNTHLKGQFLPWAIVAAFGDNMHEQAIEVAKPLNYTETQLESLKILGELLNYNAYGETVHDLHFKPTTLYRTLVRYRDPFDFINNDVAFTTLKEGFESDMKQAMELKPIDSNDKTATYKLPDARWARRISGVYGNLLAREHPKRAHAIITVDGDSGYRVSVRAPLNHRLHAETLCSQFATGGGRSAAAGINHLPAHELDRFFTAFRKTYA